MAISKIILNEATQMDLTSTTAVASDVASGKIFFLADGTQATGTNEGGINAFIITLSYNSNTSMWEPDCTWAELAAARTASKDIILTTNVL